MVQLWSGAGVESEGATVCNTHKGLKLAGMLWLAMGIVGLAATLCADGAAGPAKGWQMPATFLTISLSCFLRAWWWERVNARRQAAANGDTTLAVLAVEQPTSDESALPLPHTITLTLRKAPNVLFGFALASGLLFLFYVYRRVTGDSRGWWAIVLLAGAWVVIGLLAPMCSHPSVTVTHYGLRIRGQYRGGEVAWKEARLFAIRSGDKPGTPARHYELASERRAVEWRRIRRTRWYSLEQPDLPFDEYDREMEALLALIAAKTGLPLYDLR